MGLLESAKDELRPLTEWVFKQNRHVAKRSLDEVWDWTARRDAFRAAFAQMWHETGTADSQPIDVLLCPLYVGTAARLNESKYWNYSLLFNLLDYPGVSFPVTTVSPNLDPADIDFQPMGDVDLSIHNLCASSSRSPS